MTGAAFDPSEFLRSYSFLEELPNGLHDKVVTAGSGDLQTRVRGTLGWRKALLDGRVPSFDEAPWPAHGVHDSVTRVIRDLGLSRFCRANPEVTDKLLDQLVDIAESSARHLDDVLQALARAARAKAEEEDGKKENPAPALSAATGTSRSIVGGNAGRSTDEAVSGEAGALSQEQVEKAVAAAKGENDQAIKKALEQEWNERVRVWSELESVFGELGLLTGIGFDLSRRVIQSHGWLAAARLAKLLEQLPQLRDLIRTIGRLHEIKDKDASVLEQVFEPVTRTAEELREVRTPFAPHETRGIERSDSIARMLPAEAVLLRHPVLRTLWHARRAERALVTYRVEGTEFECVAVERVGEKPVERPRPKPERGPLIVCVDTSGSMNGLPETIAKAIALEAARTAHREKRRCLLYAFSGPGDVVEHELSFDADGIPKLLSFLSFSFGGGTDLAAPLARAAEVLSRQEWALADLVLVTDGEFPVPKQAAERLRSAREARRARMHGILIGNLHSPALSSLCDPVHVFQSWGAMLDN